MIETIYCKPTTEQGYDPDHRTRRIPKNIRQVGHPGGTTKVFIEDYVKTYTLRLAQAGFPNCSVAVLVGKMMDTEGGPSLFINGAVSASDVWNGESFEFNDSVWSSIYDQIRSYFPREEVVGWFIGGPGFLIQDEDTLRRLHIDNFAGKDKVLLTYEMLEQEDSVRICENGAFLSLPGFCIFYERNDEMQTYMLDHKPERHDIQLVGKHAEQQKDFIKAEGSTRKQKEELPAKTTHKEQKSKMEKVSGYRDMLQFGAIAGALILLVTIIVGVDILTNQPEADEPSSSVASRPTENPDELAFGDFDYTGELVVGTASGPLPQFESTDTQKENTAQQGVIAPEDGTAQENGAAQENATIQANATPQDEKAQQDTQSQANATAQQDSQEQDNATAQKDTEGGPAATVTSSGDETRQPSPDDVDPNPDVIEESEEVMAPGSYVSYYVKKGDTFASICLKTYGSLFYIDYVRELNQIEDINKIYIGQEIILPLDRENE